MTGRQTTGSIIQSTRTGVRVFRQVCWMSCGQVDDGVCDFQIVGVMGVWGVSCAVEGLRASVAGCGVSGSFSSKFRLRGLGFTNNIGGVISSMRFYEGQATPI